MARERGVYCASECLLEHGARRADMNKITDPSFTLRNRPTFGPSRATT